MAENKLAKWRCETDKTSLGGDWTSKSPNPPILFKIAPKEKKISKKMSNEEQRQHFFTQKALRDSTPKNQDQHLQPTQVRLFKKNHLLI
jgi:hypothetical protein